MQGGTHSRILVVDDHGVVRAGIAQLLSTSADLTVVATARTGEEAVKIAAQLRPDVVLMDLVLPGIDGLEATRRIRATAPGTAVVVLTSFTDGARILAAVEAGVAGYVLKDEEPSDLLRALRAAAAGGTALSPEVERIVDEARRAGCGALTARESEVLELVGEGLPNKIVARRLGIREGTVKAHLTRIYERIGVHDRTQAALWVRGALR